jgi:uncharacterized protein YcfL
MKLPALLFALLGSLLLLAGCNTPVNTIQPTAQEAVPLSVDSRVQVFDEKLNLRLGLVQVAEAESSGFRQVQVTLLNRQVRPQEFAYQFEWIRANGMAVQDPAPVWRGSRIEGGETIELQSTAPRTDAVDFRLKLRETR